MPFSIGDHVKPIRTYDREAHNLASRTEPYPSGLVTKVEPLGEGQWVFVGNDRQPYCGGAFEKVGAGR